MRGLAALILLAGCATVSPPPVTPGTLDPSTLDAGAGAVSVEGAVAGVPGAPTPPLAGLGAAHLDVGLGNRWAVRVDGSVTGLAQSAIGGGRVGLRRSVPGGRSSLGLGVSGGGQWSAGGRPLAWLGPDWELAVGDTWGIVSAGFVLRTGLTLPLNPAVHEASWTLSWSTQFSIALEPIDGHAVLLGVPAGVSVAPANAATIGWVGGSIGYRARFPAPAPRRQRREVSPPPR